MVITKLIGGIGNQMFQYAAGRRLAYTLGVELKLDITGFKSYNLRSYSLDKFNIYENFATSHEKTKLAIRKRSIIRRLWTRLLHKIDEPPSSYVKEKNFHFNPNVLRLPDNVYLDGYWQSEKYFKDIERVIHDEFSPKNSLSDKSSEIADKIITCESVGIHIRQGDYASDPDKTRIHGTCSLDYYLQAAELINGKITKPFFFVFSDSIERAQNNLKLPYPNIFVDNNQEDKDYEDLLLMSYCKHNIIANSTFSWWGAWLNPKKDKIVIAPEHWFRSVDFETKDLIPDNWIKL